MTVLMHSAPHNAVKMYQYLVETAGQGQSCILVPDKQSTLYGRLAYVQATGHGRVLATLHNCLREG